MGIFNLFKGKPKENKYELLYGSISEILKLLERKRGLVDGLQTGGSIVDLEFDSLMIERMKLVDLIKNGSISFLGNEFKNEILKIFDKEETEKDTIQQICNYLINEQNKLKKLF
jgi:hypothetical protein